MNKRAVGAAYEAKAAKHLESLGYRILERNYRCRTGEIDLVAMHEGCLVFVEVKYRQDAHAGYGAEAVTWRKRQQIVKACPFIQCIFPQALHFSLPPLKLHCSARLPHMGQTITTVLAVVMAAEEISSTGRSLDPALIEGA